MLKLFDSPQLRVLHSFEPLACPPPVEASTLDFDPWGDWLGRGTRVPDNPRASV